MTIEFGSVSACQHNVRNCKSCMDKMLEKFNSEKWEKKIASNYIIREVERIEDIGIALPNMIPNNPSQKEMVNVHKYMEKEIKPMLQFIDEVTGSSSCPEFVEDIIGFAAHLTHNEIGPEEIAAIKEGAGMYVISAANDLRNFTSDEIMPKANAGKFEKIKINTKQPEIWSSIVSKKNKMLDVKACSCKVAIIECNDEEPIAISNFEAKIETIEPTENDVAAVVCVAVSEVCEATMESVIHKEQFVAENRINEICNKIKEEEKGCEVTIKFKLGGTRNVSRSMKLMQKAIGNDFPIIENKHNVKIINRLGRDIIINKNDKDYYEININDLHNCMELQIVGNVCSDIRVTFNRAEKVINLTKVRKSLENAKNSTVNSIARKYYKACNIALDKFEAYEVLTMERMISLLCGETNDNIIDYFKILKLARCADITRNVKMKNNIIRLLIDILRKSNNKMLIGW